MLIASGGFRKINLVNYKSINNDLAIILSPTVKILNTMALDKDKALEKAKNSKALTMGTSAFVTGAQFTITGYSYEAVEGSDAFYPAFQTPLGTLSVQSLLRAKAVKPYTDKDGNLVTTRQPQGTFHDLIRKVLGENRGKTADEVLPLLVKACEGKRFVVRQREYVTVETKFGDRAQPLCHIDIVVE